MFKKIILISIILLNLLSVVTPAFAVIYQPLAPLQGYIEPGQEGVKYLATEGGAEQGLTGYLKTMYRLGVGIATALAVIMIMWGGIEYMSTDAIGGKEEGKERINNALAGLLLALGSYIILRTINKELVETDLNITELNIVADQAQFPDLIGESDFEPTLAGSEQIVTANGVYLNGNIDEELRPYIEHGPYDSKLTDPTHAGQHSPYIQYINDYGEQNYPALDVSNTVRTLSHPQSQKNPDSDHIHGQAIDFHPASGYDENSKAFIREANQLVEWSLANGQKLGIDQIIFQDKNYRLSNGKYVKAAPVSGHNNHVHIGRRRD